jgi:hypothetical protein
MRDRDGAKGSANLRRHGREEYLRQSAEIATEYLDTLKTQAKSLSYNVLQIKDTYDTNNIEAARDTAGNMHRTLYDAEKFFKKYYHDSYEFKITPFPETKRLTTDIYAYLSNIKGKDLSPIHQVRKVFKLWPFFMTGIPTPGVIKEAVTEVGKEKLLAKTKAKAQELEDILLAHKNKPRRLREILYVSSLIFGIFFLFMFMRSLSISGFVIRYPYQTMFFNYTLAFVIIGLVIVGFIIWLKSVRPSFS